MREGGRRENASQSRSEPLSDDCESRGDSLNHHTNSDRLLLLEEDTGDEAHGC